MEDVVERLKPCPFCGKTPKLICNSQKENRYNYYIIRCSNSKCPASCVSVMDKTAEKAVSRWNSRSFRADVDDYQGDS